MDFQIDWSKIDSTLGLLNYMRENQVPANMYGYYVEQYQSMKAKEKGIPLHGLFELTPLCNLDCQMCYVHLESEKVKKSRLLSVEQWKNLIMQVYNAGMRYATLSGGECLIYPGFRELYLYLYNMGIRPVIKTNALLLKGEWLDFFIKYPPRKIEISLYGCTEEGYERVTGYRVFHLIKNNLELIKDAHLPVTIAITPSKYLQDELVGVAKIAKDLGFSHFINYCLFEPREETGREKCDLTTDEYICMLKKVSEINGENVIALEEGIELPEFGKTFEPRYGIACGAGRNAFNITWDGMLCGCLNLTTLNSSVLDKTFEEAWEEVHANARNLPIPMECTCCAYSNVCAGCVACHNINGDTSHCNPEVCERTKAMVKNGFLKLSSSK